MSLPIDEMLLELRYALDVFDLNPSDDTFAKVQYECARIERECENVLAEEVE